MTRFLFAFILVLGFPAALLAQGTSLAIGSGAFDADQPVEVSADALSVDQGSGAATFEGNVLVVQGDVRLSADQVIVVYALDEAGNPSGIDRLVASGGVTFVTPTDAVEAETAEYSIADSMVTLTGDVLLTQGSTAISGESLVIDLNSGSGRMEGRVRTIIGGSNN